MWALIFVFVIFPLIGWLQTRVLNSRYALYFAYMLTGFLSIFVAFVLIGSISILFEDITSRRMTVTQPIILFLAEEGRISYQVADLLLPSLDTLSQSSPEFVLMILIVLAVVGWVALLFPMFFFIGSLRFSIVTANSFDVLSSDLARVRSNLPTVSEFDAVITYKFNSVRSELNSISKKIDEIEIRRYEEEIEELIGYSSEDSVRRLTSYIRRLNRKGITAIDLAGACLRNAHLVNLDLSGANLENADLTGASLNRVVLKGTKINESTIMDEKWRTVWEIVNRGRTTSLESADLSDSYLCNADLSHANLSGANLSTQT
jgi:hypothetical protein